MERTGVSNTQCTSCTTAISHRIRKNKTGSPIRNSVGLGEQQLAFFHSRCITCYPYMCNLRRGPPKNDPMWLNLFKLEDKMILSLRMLLPHTQGPAPPSHDLRAMPLLLVLILRSMQSLYIPLRLLFSNMSTSKAPNCTLAIAVRLFAWLHGRPSDVP